MENLRKIPFFRVRSFRFRKVIFPLFSDSRKNQIETNRIETRIDDVWEMENNPIIKSRKVDKLLFKIVK
jgi:hypothetical protein